MRVPKESIQPGRAKTSEQFERPRCTICKHELLIKCNFGDNIHQQSNNTNVVICYLCKSKMMLPDLTRSRSVLDLWHCIHFCCSAQLRGELAELPGILLQVVTLSQNFRPSQGSVFAKQCTHGIHPQPRRT